MPFDYTSGNPDNLVGGAPARMQDIQGPFFDIRAWLNSPAGGGGASIPVLAGVPVLDVGMANQRRAGRQLANADFTSLGLGVPIALWNLGDLLDTSGNGRVLTNKGGVGFGSGINGVAATSAVFTGSGAQALYVADTGAADPFRIKVGSWGCWMRTAKRGTDQYVLSKVRAAPLIGWNITISASNLAIVTGSLDGTATAAATGTSDVADDRWHFIVGTHDGTLLRLYVDGVPEAQATLAGALFGSSAPVNVGAFGADGGTAAGLPHFGRVDEAFVTGDVLTEEQVRSLYAIKLTHTLGAQPSAVTFSVHRKRKGAALVAADFTTQPLRLHNFTAGALTDEGSNGTALSAGSAYNAAGADGTSGNAHGFTGAGSDFATDAGLPSGTNPRSYGCWFKTTINNATIVVLAWGTSATGHVAIAVSAPGVLNLANAGDTIAGPYIADGQWHHIVVVEDNAAVDGVKRKGYLDGRLIGGSVTLNGIVLAGANRFRVGANTDGTLPFTGQIDGVFVCGYAMTQADVLAIYAKGSLDLGASPKDAGSHIERMDNSSLLLIADTLGSQDTLDVGVTA